MADFDKNVNINVKLNTRGFGRLSNAAEQLDDLADSLDGMENIVDDVNNVMSDFDDGVADIDASGIKELNEQLEILDGNKESAAKANKILSKANEDTEGTANKEAKAFHNLIDAGSSLSDVKHAARESNELLTKANREGARSALLESNGWMQVVRAGGDLEDTLDSLIGKHDDHENSSGGAARALRRLTRNSDEAADSFRAASKVGELFEDGLGSLSVNIGAFTVALRNFLTQVPLLVSALGALASSAVGVAGAFLTAGTAIGAAIGAGAIGRAQRLKEEYEGIEGIGQGLAVIFGTARDMMLEAISPLTENAQTFELFKDTLEGTADFISMMAGEINRLMENAGDLPEGVMSITETFHKLGRELDGPLARVVAESSRMFMVLQDEFIDMTVGMVDAIADLIRFSTDFTDGITSAGRAIDTLTASIAELSELGMTVFSGLAPIIIGFFSALERVAAVLNKIDSELLAAAITFGILMAGMNKFLGVIASVVTVMPNLIFAILGAEGSVDSLLGSFRDFLSEHGGFLAGFVSLGEALDNIGDEMDLLALKTDIAEEGFENFSEELNDTILDLIATEESIEDVNRELTEMALRGELAEEAMDDLDNVDLEGPARRGRGAQIVPLPDRGGFLGRIRGFVDDIVQAFKKGGVRGVITTLGGAIVRLGSMLGGLTGPLMLFVAILGGVAVGAITNFDAVLGAVSGTLNVVGGALKAFTKGTVLVFIAVWNLMVDALMAFKMAFGPLLGMFDSGTSSGGDFAGVLEAIGTAFSFVIEFIVAMLDVLGTVFQIVGFLIGLFMSFFKVIGLISKAIATSFIVQLLDLLGVTKAVNTSIGETQNAISGLIDFILSIPDVSMEMMEILRESIESLFNDVIIRGLNEVIKRLNMLPGVSMELMEEVDLAQSGAEGLRVSADELSADTDNMFGATEPNRQPNINYNKYETQNINQQIDADPEEKQQLSRVVKDAMEEANSFERRRQGFPG